MKFGSPILLDPGTLIAGALGIGGSLISANGAKSAANASADAAREGLAFQKNQFDIGKALQLAMAYGGEQALPMIQAMLGPEAASQLFGTPGTGATPLTDAEQRRLAELKQQRGTMGNQSVVDRLRAQRGGNRGQASAPNTSAIDAEIAALESKAGGSPGTAGRFNVEDFKKLGPNFFGQMNTLADQAKQQGEAGLAGLDTGLAGLRADDAKLKADAEKNYQDISGTLERDAGRALTGTNRASIAAANASGMGGSSVVGNQIGANAMRLREVLNDGKMNLAQQKNQFMTGLGERSLDRNQALTLSRYGLGQDVANRDIGMRSGALSSQMGLLTGAAFNPWLNRDSSQYFQPGGAGVGSQMLGNTAAGMGSQILGYSLENLFGNKKE